MVIENLHVDSSNLNVPIFQAVRSGDDAYLDFIEKAGYGPSACYEWTPLRFPAARRAARDLAAIGHISVLHESWREQSMVEAVRSGIGTTMIALAFPQLDSSYDALADIQTASRQFLPIIVHPEGQYLDNQPPRRPRQSFDHNLFREVWYQPTAEWAWQNGITTTTSDTAAVFEQVVHVAKTQGLDRIALDLHHLQRERAGQQFRNPGELAVLLADHTSLGEIQLSLRPDFGGSGSELALACHGKLASTPTGEILSAIGDALPSDKTLRVVIEIAASEIAQAAADLPLTEAHQAIINGIQTLVPAKRFNQSR